MPEDVSVPNSGSPGAVIASRKLEGNNATETGDTEQEEEARSQQSPSKILITRKNIYQMLESRMRS